MRPADRVSLALSLSVGAMAQGDGRLPRPAIAEAGSGDVLDLSTFDGDPRATVAPWPLIAEGQTCWLAVDGTLEDGRPDHLVLRDGAAVTPAEVDDGLELELDRSRIETWQDGTSVIVTFKANLREGDETGALLFPPRTYRLKRVSLPPLTITGPTSATVGDTLTYGAQGGVPPYSFATGNAAVATLSAQGTGRAVSAGTADITATDTAGSSTSLSLNVAAPTKPDMTPDYYEGATTGVRYEFSASGGVPPYRWSLYLEAGQHATVLVADGPVGVIRVDDFGKSNTVGVYLDDARSQFDVGVITTYSGRSQTAVNAAAARRSSPRSAVTHAPSRPDQPTRMSTMTAQHAASARAPQTSLPLQLSIGDVEDGDNGVAPPTIVEADDDRVVDLGTFEGNATVHVDAWPLMAAGQRYWLTAIAGTETYVVVDGALVTGPATLDLPLSRAWLEDLADGASFDIELAIAFGGGELATAKRFTSLSHWLRQGTPATGWTGLEYIFEPMDQYEAFPIRQLGPNQPYTLRFGTVTSFYRDDSSWVDELGFACYITPRPNNRFRLDYPVPRIDFSTPIPPNTGEIVAYDSAGREIVRQALVQNNKVWAGSSTGVRSFEVISHLPTLERISIDDFKIWTGSTWKELPTPLIETFDGWPMDEHDRRFDVGNWSITGDTCTIAVVPYPTDPQRHTLRFSRLRDSLLTPFYLVHLTPRGLLTPVHSVTVRIRRERTNGDHLAAIRSMLAYANRTTGSQRIVGPQEYSFPDNKLEHVITFSAPDQMPLPGEHVAFICIRMGFSGDWVPVYIDEIAIE